MSNRLLVISTLSLHLFILGCGTPENPDQVPDGDSVQPIKAAFDEKELGQPVDWKSLSDSDRAFLSALSDRDATKATAALKAGAKADLNCGHGCNVLMLAAATGDAGLVAAVRKAGAQETPDAKPYLEILNFARNAESPAYKAALAEIAQLSGTSLAPGERPGLYTFRLDTKEAGNFLKKHHARLLDRGCYVFLYEQNFGIRGEADVLWILPTKDKFAVMTFTGVDGINYDIDNYLVIRWMKKLDQDHPYLLTGCGRDFLSGHFTTKLSDVDAMAKRMYAFCPDIVDQGTGSVRGLANELQKTNAMYFWWD